MTLTIKIVKDKLQHQTLNGQTTQRQIEKETPKKPRVPKPNYSNNETTQTKRKTIITNPILGQLNHGIKKMDPKYTTEASYYNPKLQLKHA